MCVRVCLQRLFVAVSQSCLWNYRDEDKSLLRRVRLVSDSGMEPVRFWVIFDRAILHALMRVCLCVVSVCVEPDPIVGASRGDVSRGFYHHSYRRHSRHDPQL